MTPRKPAQQTETASLSTFELGDEELAMIAPKGGRVAKPSVYLDEVRDAVKTGRAVGIPTSATVKGAYILGQLRKAEKELGVKLKKWNREDATPRGFVGFQVVTESENENSEVK